jgi:L-alanine-DL-glutamate epimerase-like enolase superfamily enzyme
VARVAGAGRGGGAGRSGQIFDSRARIVAIAKAAEQIREGIGQEGNWAIDICDTHKVGIVPHFTGPVSTAAHIHTMTSFPGQVVMEYNYGATPPPHVSEFVDFKDGKCWPNDRPGL